MTTTNRRMVALLIGLHLAAGAALADDDPAAPGRAHFDAGRFDEAKAVFTAVLADDAQDHEAWAYLGRIALQEKTADRAVECLSTAVELREEASMYQTWLAQAYLLKLRDVPFMEKGRYSQLMIKHLNRAIELDTENVEARATLAGFYAQAPPIAGGNIDKARQQIEIIKTIDPERGAAIAAALLPAEEK